MKVLIWLNRHMPTMNDTPGGLRLFVTIGFVSDASEAAWFQWPTAKFGLSAAKY